MPVNQEHFLQEFRDSLNDIRDGIREGLSVVNSRLTTIDNRLHSGEERFQRLETRVFSGSPSPGGNGRGREAASNGNGKGCEYYTISVGKRTVLSVPRETMGRLRKWAVVILACLITGNADRLYALIRTTVRATIEATAPLSSTSGSGVPALPLPPER